MGIGWLIPVLELLDMDGGPVEEAAASTRTVTGTWAVPSYTGTWAVPSYTGTWDDPTA